MSTKKDLRRLIDQIKLNKDRKAQSEGLQKTVAEDLKKQFGPSIESAIERGLSGLKLPETKIPEFPKFPEQKEPIVNVEAPIVNVPAPIVNVPAPVVNVPAPIVNIPEQEFPTDFKLKGVDKLNPLPVAFYDEKGKPARFGSGDGMSVGGRADFFTIKDIQTSSGASIIDQVEGAVKVTGSFSVTASNTSTQLIDSSENAVGTAANPLNVALVSGSSSSTNAQIGNSDGDYSVSNPLPILLAGASGTTGAALIDSMGVQYSGSNPLPVTFSAASFQNVAMFDAQQSSITSHQDGTGDFRGLDVAVMKNITFQSVLNSSQTALGSGATFTGLAEEVKDYGSIHVAIFADQASGTDGLSLQQSNDGTNWDFTDVYTISASTGKFISVPVYARYYRLVYTNSGSAQSAFRAYSYFKPVPAKPSSQRSQDAYTNETDLEQIWSFMAAFNGTTWDRLRNTAGEGNALRVQMANDAVASVNLVGDNVSLDVLQVSGSVFSVNIVGPIAQGDEATAVRVVHAGNSAASVATQATGLNETTAGVLRAVLMTDSTNSTNISQWGGTTIGTGISDNGTNVVKTYQVAAAVSSVYVTGSSGTTQVVGDIASDVADTESNPVKIGGIARTANPTSVAAGDRVSGSFDVKGRQIVRPYQMRDLVVTAYATTTTAVETTLLAASAGSFHDLVMLTATNGSTASVTVDIREVTAGNIVHTMVLPASTGPIGWAPAVPYPQSSSGNNWTVDVQGSDISNTSVYYTALFLRES